MFRSFTIVFIVSSFLSLLVVGRQVIAKEKEIFTLTETKKSALKLHPKDVDIIMAMGDSITAAFGVGGIKSGFTEIRGVSWAIGGDDGAITLPNYIKKFGNSDVRGASLGSHFMSLCWGRLCPSFTSALNNADDNMNGALSGAMINDLSIESDYLRKEVMRKAFTHNSTSINRVPMMKVLTLFIGANDVCNSCHHTEEKMKSPNEWGKNMHQTIEDIRTNFSPVFLNIVEMFNVSQVYDATKDREWCKNVHKYFFMECDCAFSLTEEAKAHRQEMDEMAQKYNEKTREIVQEHYFDKENMINDDFAIAVHPFGRNQEIKNFNAEMFSTLDCFHPSLKSHETMATALWNSMLTPPSQRKTTIDLDDVPITPLEDSIFYPGVTHV